MKSSLIFLLSIFFAFSIGTITSFSTIQNPRSIEGSWQLVKFIDYSGNSRNWQENPSHILYQKHINGTHFVWYKYDLKEDKMIGTGGGTYQIDHTGKYIENIDFFFPPGSSELGQAIPFTVEMKKGKWYHTGYAKTMEYNQLGENVATDSIKIEEIWEPLLSKTQNNYKLVGTWKLLSYRNNTNEPYQEYPNFIGYMKILTSTHFFWIKYNMDGDQIFAVGGGKYSLNSSGEYTEFVEMTHPQNSVAKGKVIIFSPEINEHKWVHYGIIPGVSDISQSIIDEIWEPWTKTNQ